MTCIKGFENYIIFEDGMIINFWTGLEMKPYKNHDGYYQIKLSKNGKRKNFRLNRLLALAFIPNPENKPEVDHIDRNRNNNNLENLHWVTRLENLQNKGKYKNNTSGNKNIMPFRNGWQFKKTINKKRYQKFSTDKQVVLDYKAQFLLEHNLKD
jgi:hypothetical protein